MKDQNPVIASNQNNDQLDLKPYSPDKIKKPEKIKSDERIISKNKEDNQKDAKLLKSKLIDDDIEHPEPLFSDISEESIGKIKKNFYDNQQKENLLIMEYKRDLKIKNEEIKQQQLKKAKDSLQLKENIGKVVLNSEFMNDKNLKKQNSQKTNLLIKPKKVVKNFILGISNDNNITEQNNLNNSEINNNNNNKIGIKKNNSLNVFKNLEKQKLIKHNNNNINKSRPIIKIPLNLTEKNKQTINKINAIPQPQSLLIKKEQNVENNKLKYYYSNKNDINKIPLKKITRIVPINNNTYDYEKSNNQQENSRQNSYNYIYKIRTNPSKKNPNERSNNIALNNMVININYNTLIKDNSRNNIKKNFSFQNVHDNNKIVNYSQLAHNTVKSNFTCLNENQKDGLKRISISIKNNNKSTNMMFYQNLNDKKNYYKSDAEINNSSRKNILANRVNRINDSYNDSEKENYMNNSNFYKCNRKTIEKGGKFNNISTTYVVISKNSRSKANFSQPSLTLENHNLSKKIISSNLSQLSFSHNQTNPVVPLNQIFHQNRPINQTKKIKTFRSQNNLFCPIKSYNQNTINNSHITNNINNFSIYGRNHTNLLDTNKTHFIKNKRVNKPVIYKYNYGNNLWLDESVFNYSNTTGYNY